MSKFTSKDNSPNPARLIQSLRHLGYDNYGALCDLIDNAIDADAKNVYIKIGHESKDFVITIADDGCGMDEKTLDQAVRLGSLTDRDPNSDLGKFGMGLSTASMSLARRTEVLTKQRKGALLKSVVDIDEIVKSNTFSKEEGLASDADAHTFKLILPGDVESGTIATLRKCDNVKNDNVTVFCNTLKKEVGRIFRLFINSGRNIYVNDTKVQATDPLMIGARSEVLCDEDFPVKLEVSGKVIEDIVRIKIAKLPEYTQEENREKGINIRNQGFYIMRNQREIANGSYLDGMFTKHNDLNRFRAEIYFSGLLDDLVGVNFTKKEVHFNQMLWDKINAISSGHIREIRRRSVKDRVKNESSIVSHDESVRQISKKAKLLITPAPVEVKTVTEKEKKEETRKRKELIETPREDMERIVSRCRFEPATLGRLGPIYNAFPEGRKLVIQLNIEHPFYERFYLWSQDNPDLQRGIDFMVYSMASAEMTVVSGRDDDTLEMMESLKGIMSSNLRILLS